MGRHIKPHGFPGALRVLIATEFVAPSGLRVGVFEVVSGLAGLPFTTRPGLAPAGELLFFVSPKKPNEKKGDPTVCDPSLRYGHPAVLSPAGVSLNSPAAQTIASPDPSGLPLLGAYRRGECRYGCGFGVSPHPNPPPAGEGVMHRCVRWSLNFCQPRSGWAEQRRWRRDLGRSCLREGSAAAPGRSRAAQVARSGAQGPRLRVAFLLGTFLWRSKEQVPRPPGRDPAWQQRAKHPTQKPPQQTPLDQTAKSRTISP